MLTDIQLSTIGLFTMQDINHATLYFILTFITTPRDFRWHNYSNNKCYHMRPRCSKEVLNHSKSKLRYWHEGVELALLVILR